MYDVYSKFDFIKHKQKYIHYLEVIILPNGQIEYAVPSHQEKLIYIACEQLNITRQKLGEMCPEEYYCDFLTWLCKITNCISVWTNFYIKDTINSKQIESLHKLKEFGLYEGDLLD